METSIFIFRRDLRVYDNLALSSLLSKMSSSDNLLPIFIFNPKQIFAKNNSYFSNNAVQFMIESLGSLEEQIGHVNYYEDDDINVLNKLLHKYKIKNIAFNRDYTPFSIKRDAAITEWCEKHGIHVIAEEDYTLHEMGKIVNGSGKPYQVYTPFYKAALKTPVKKPVTINIDKVDVIKSVTKFDKHKYYKLNPDIAIHGGRNNALKRMKMNYGTYTKDRDYPAKDKTTKLSAYIKFGCVSIREVFHHYAKRKNKGLIRELIWREFYANIMYYFPHILGNSFKKKYDKVKWSNNKEWFKAWCDGRTGFPLVDAGMKQLNKTGYMHNRCRMIVASFLTKDLLIDWRWGEQYFARHLVDYDPASNNGGWQWSASCGTDAQPYFRIFSPDLQLKKYDKDFEYVKKWNPNYRDIKPIIDHTTRAKIAIKVFANAAQSSGD